MQLVNNSLSNEMTLLRTARHRFIFVTIKYAVKLTFMFFDQHIFREILTQNYNQIESETD